jgi:hypothetical protein
MVVELTFAGAAAQNDRLVRRLPAILLLIGFAALGSGLLEDLHLRTHVMERAAVGHAGADSTAPHDRDDGCALCANLHLPRIGGGYVPLLVCVGLFVAFRTLLAPQLASQFVADRIDCRGPPAL